MSDRASLLRILGTFTIDSINDLHDHSLGKATAETSSTQSTESVVASSESCSVISLFVGSSPVSFVSDSASKKDLLNIDCADQDSYQSTILQQECRHFCSMQRCYRSSWTTKNIFSKLTVNSVFHLDGIVQTTQLPNFFVLNWARQAVPSSVKWTRDIHDVGNNCPGSLRLTVPCVVFNASLNVRSLVSLLDTHIETFMKVRAKIHNTSSFK